MFVRFANKNLESSRFMGRTDRALDNCAGGSGASRDKCITGGAGWIWGPGLMAGRGIVAAIEHEFRAIKVFETDEGEVAWFTNSGLNQ